MRYLLCTNTGNEHLAKKFDQAVLTCVRRDASEMSVCLRRFFVRQRFLASENGIYELASTFCHAGLVLIIIYQINAEGLKVFEIRALKHFF